MGAEILVGRVDLAPGLKVLAAGCGPGRLTVPVARLVDRGGELVALAGRYAGERKLERPSRKPEAEITA